MDAHRYAPTNGKTLASHALLDEGVMRGKVRHATYAREWLVYPMEYGKFKKGRDIVDSEIGSRIPWSAVKGLDICRPNIGLLVDPKDLDVFKKTGGIVVLPESVILLENFIQKSGNGKADEATKIPLAVPKELWYKLSDGEKRWLHRVAGQGVRPLVRDHHLVYGSRGVGADLPPLYVRRMAFEEIRVAGAPKHARKHPSD